MDQSNAFADACGVDYKVQLIMRQTDYTEAQSMSELVKHDYDHIATIKTYFGIPDKKPQPVKSVNQEIYKQIRYKLDDSMKNYREKKEHEDNYIHKS